MFTFWFVTSCDQEMRSTLTMGTIQKGCKGYHCLHNRERTAASFVDFFSPWNFTDWLYTLGWVFCITHYTLNILWIHTGTRPGCMHKSSCSSPFLPLYNCFFCKRTQGHKECSATYSDGSVTWGSQGHLEVLWSAPSHSFDTDIVPACLYLTSVQDSFPKIPTPHLRASLSFLYLGKQANKQNQTTTNIEPTVIRIEAK